MAYRRLRRELQEGSIQPGELLAQASIAERFGISRTPVREALQRLEHEGTLKSLPKRGWIVRTISAKEVEELYTIRMRLETLAARLAASRSSDEAIAELQAILDRQADEVRSTRDPEKAHVIDREFHHQIWVMSDSPRLEQMLSNLVDAATLDPVARSIRGRPRRMEESVEHHRRILEAVVAHDGAGAEQAMHEHNRWHMQKIVTHLFGEHGQEDLP